MKAKIRFSLVLIVLTSFMFGCATPKKEAELEYAESPQETTKPILTSLESFPLPDGVTVHVFQKSPKEQIRVTVGDIEGKTYLDLRIFNQVAQYNYVPSNEGLTIPAELLPELQMTVEKLQQKLLQSPSTDPGLF